MPVDCEKEAGALLIDHGAGPWRPMLDGALRRQALEVAAEIAEALRDPAPASVPGEWPEMAQAQVVEDGSLSGGRAGLAVLFAYLAQARSEPGDADIALGFLNDAVEAVASVPMSDALYSGFTGVAWAVAHLQERLSLPTEEDPNEAIDEALLDSLNRSPWPGEYDLISGLVGLGVYALERLPRPTARACLERVIARLAEMAERGEHGTTWFTPPERLPDWQRERCPRGYYNLGLAHGVPGVIALLGGACAAGVARAEAQPLLQGAVEWLLHQKLPEGAGSSFSSWAGPGVEQDASRLAWCYGDVGASAALLCAARCVGEPIWEREAIEIVRGAAERAPEQAGIVDAGLCHGAAGLGHLFNRMYQATGEAALGEAAHFWLQRTLAMRQPGEGVGGYLAWEPREAGEVRWVADPGLLTGAAGVALALLAAATAVEPAWDRMLLVSVPPRPAKEGGSHRDA
jgi:lantibiotic modifying enzyme